MIYAQPEPAPAGVHLMLLDTLITSKRYAHSGTLLLFAYGRGAKCFLISGTFHLLLHGKSRLQKFRPLAVYKFY